MIKPLTELTPGDRVIVEPTKGNRSDEVVSVTRTSGRYAFEVRYRRSGTYHYMRSDGVEISPTIQTTKETRP